MVEKYEYRNGSKVTTEIWVDLSKNKVKIKNHTRELLDTAFGCVKHPTVEDFEDLLESRCFPRTRRHVDWCLKELGLDFYDPYAIVDVTDGKMEGDNFSLVHLEK